MKSLAVFLIVSLLIVVHNAEAMSNTTTTVTIMVEPKGDISNSKSAGSSGSVSSTTESTDANKQQTTTDVSQTVVSTDKSKSNANQHGTHVANMFSGSSFGSPIQFPQVVSVGSNQLEQEDNLHFLLSDRMKLPRYEENPTSVLAKPEIIGPLAAAVGVGLTSAFPIKPVGFSAASLKSFRVAIMYRKSELFSKTQTVFALAFLALTVSGFSKIMNIEIISFFLLPTFFGLVIYHNMLWYVRYSYCSVSRLAREIFTILPILSILGYLLLLYIELISFDILQTIAVIGMAITVPSTIFTALSFRDSRLETKWILITVGLTASMLGIILPISFMAGPLILGDILVLFGCGLVVWGQYNLSTKYSTE